MFEKVRRKIRHIQNSEDKIKKRWLIGLSGISMVIVILLWGVYLNISIPTLESGEEEKNTGDEKGESFFAVFERGFRIVAGNVMGQASGAIKGIEEMIGKIKSQVERSNEFIITPQ
jgi:hypothetical protein